MKVLKRDNRKEEFDVNKIKQVIKWATNALDVNPLVLESKFDEFLKEDITTDDIQTNLIYHSRILCSPQEPEWSIVAGRLETMRQWKRTQIFEKTFHYYIQEQIDKNIYRHPSLNKWTKREVIALGKYIDQNRDLEHSYGSVLTAHKKYLLKNECIQQMHMTNAMIIGSVEDKMNRLSFTKEVYDALSQRKLSLATPWLSNLRADKNISSCFIIQVDDDMESIADNWKNAAMISKFGGGLGIDMSKIRAKGARIDMVENASKGITSWAKIFNDIAVAVDQSGKRSGAFTIHTPIWHRDIEDFLELQTENGDLRNKAFDIFPQVGVMDIFMKELEKDNGGTWYTFCPKEVKDVLGLELAGIYGKEFNTNYRKCVTAYTHGKLKNVGCYNARDLLITIMRTQLETGLPYLPFLDRINEHNPNSHDGTIPCGNLCVAPETQILTDIGHVTISDYVNEKLNIWNGVEFSNVEIIKTGTNQKLLKVITSSGQELECTEYHKFYIQSDYKNVIEKRTHELKQGDKLIKFDLPVIEGTKVLQKAYTNGFFSADGNVTKNKKYVYLYCDKIKLKKHIEHEGSWNSTNEKYCIKTSSIAGLKDKFFVPTNEYTIDSRLAWLAGYLDGDGCIAKNGTNESLQASSIDHNFLKEIQLMLQTLGITSKIVDGMPEADRMMPDGKGGEKLYHCQETKRLLISSNGLYKLSELGFKTNRLKWTARLPQRQSEHFIRVEAVIDIGRYDDTFCFTEPKRHMGMFNGLLTGQCQESFSNVKAGELSHTCNLLSLVVGRIDSDAEMIRLARLGTRILDNGIALTNNPIQESKNHNDRYRTIGIGIQGLHDYIAKKNLSWENYKEITKVAELIEYGTVVESILLASERNKYPVYEGSKWDTGEMINKFHKHSVTDLDWNGLQELLDTFGIRNSQLTSPAPNTSTSIFMDACAGVMPTMAGFYTEDNMTGQFSVYGMYLKENPLAYEHTQPRMDQVKLAKMIGSLQKFVDTGISAEYIFDLNKEGVDAKSLYDLILAAWKEKTKSIYYIRSIKKGDNIDDVIGAEVACVSCAG